MFRPFMSIVGATLAVARRIKLSPRSYLSVGRGYLTPPRRHVVRPPLGIILSLLLFEKLSVHNSIDCLYISRINRVSVQNGHHSFAQLRLP